ncbi:MAG: hypothetical protein IPH06_05050 [Alphaproteobacteria bacterium]|nr:hypothetical protein [Alphaproteobacteria bacterium]QQS57391.1 MAG: hypothetical protein IPN28_00810 [Alphaproteobacteria bacterium]
MAGGTTTHYVYGLGGLLYGEYDNSGVLIREYIWLNGEPLAQVTKSGGTETVTYLHTDHLATPRYGTNAAGSTVWIWDSGAFGKEAPTGSVSVNLRFPGQYFDAESALLYNWNRYYNPATGRYISGDPLGISVDLNVFAYASLNPLTYVDPRGLRKWTGRGIAPGDISSLPSLGTQPFNWFFKTTRYFFIAFYLTSECIDGKRDHTAVLAEGFATTTNISKPFMSRTFTKVEFEDGMPSNAEPDDSVFNGGFEMVANRYQGCQITLGNAKSTTVVFTGGPLVMQMAEPGTSRVNRQIMPLSEEGQWNSDVKECRK